MKRTCSFLIFCIVLLLLFGCTNKKADIATTLTSTDIALTPFYETKVDYPVFPEFDERVNQQIKKAAYTMIGEEEDSNNIDCGVKYQVMLKNKKVISIAFSGYIYWRGAAHPNSFFHTINVDLQTGNKIRLPDVLDINKETILFLLENNINQPTSSTDWLAEEIRQRFYDDALGLQSIVDADSEELPYGVFSYFTPEVLVIRLPWYDKHVELEILWTNLETIGIKYDPRN
jgi:hypothetical protein